MFAASVLLAWCFVVGGQGAAPGDAANKDTDDLIQKMTEKLDAALKDSMKTIKLDPKQQEALDEIGVSFGDDNVQRKENLKPDKSLFEGAPNTWPGQGKPFGSVDSLSKKLEIIDGKIKPITFINRYGRVNSPVLFPGLIAKSPGLLTWDVNYLGNAPPAAMSNVSVYTIQNNSLIHSLIALRDFIRSEDRDQLIFDDVPSFMMKDVVFPNVLKCKKVLDSLLKHTLIYYKHSTLAEPLATVTDRFVCPMKGNLPVVLIPASSWELYARNESSITYSAIDYTSHPWLKDLDYHSGLMKPGDCVFVPRDWYAQMSHLSEPSAIITFSWENIDEKVSRLSCGDNDLENDHHLGSYAHYFKSSKVQRDSLKDALIHYFAFYLGENLMSTFTQKQFIRKIKRDDKLLSRLLMWTDDFTDISSEVFDLLDIDKDARFNVHDLKKLAVEDREEIVSQLQDRLHDFSALMDQQQKIAKEKQASEKPKNKPAEPTSEAKSSPKPKAVPDDLAKEFSEALNKEMEKLFKDLETNVKSEKVEKQSTDPSPEKAKNTNKDETKKQIKEKAEQKAERKTANQKPQDKTEEKYKEVIEDAEEEIIAEEDERVVTHRKSGEEKISQVNKKPAESGQTSTNKKVEL